MHRVTRLFVFSLLLVASALWSDPAAAQGASDHVQWTATILPETVQPGQTAQVVLQARIGEGWKMYALDTPPGTGLPVKVTLDELPEGLAAGEVGQSTPTEGYDPNFDAVVTYFTDEARITADVAVAETVEAEALDVSGTVQFMICNANLCLPPTREPFAVTLQVGTDAASGANNVQAPQSEQVPQIVNPGADEEEDEAVAAPAPPSGVQGGDAQRGDGMWAFLLLAAGAGMAALLTPCVFPMIPLTVSYFTKHSGDRGEAFRMASVYGFTIVLTFTGLGVLTAMLVGAAGAQTIAANPWINLFIGLIFVVFALSLLGLFELRLPSGLLNYFNRQSSEHGGYVGVLFMGFTLTLVSFSCTAPFVGGLLAATTHGEWAYPIVGMLVFSAVFSLPFVVFALFPNGLNSLPRSGGWMNAVKVTLGFVELAAAIKFLSNADLVWGWGLITRPLAIAFATVIFALAGLYLLGKLRLRHEAPVEEVGVGRLMASIAFFGIALFLLPGLFGAPLGRLDAYLPPRQVGDVSLVGMMQQSGGSGSAHEAFDWHDDIDAAFAQARADDQPVFIDFTGYTCTNCREMEANVFPRQAVAERLRNDFVLLRLYTDDRERGPDLQRYQLQLTGTVALPTYAVVHPDGETVLAQISGMTPAGEFVAFLDRGVSAAGEGRIALR